MRFLSGLVLVARSVFFIWLTVLVFRKPRLAERFFMSFASSARTHFIEQIFRVLLGESLVIYSPAMAQTEMFRLVGWAIAVSSVGLMLIPWQWHHRFGKKVLPALIQHMRLYAFGIFAFGVVILYAVFAPQLNGAA